ncbi:hypothetical protein GOP47_0020585 [Adiantum capillus-veneris]|uniref:Uncharacterized protein n=1 Tax=Adiantum capillus-veneris TaxID=13818 RepID=A0A9D4U9Z6_ADICA|nr:hypothetical protein GOP47_0020585 [Adiantum capillus-veneris]
MSVCLRVSPWRDVLCTSPPEPALNEAAASVLRGARQLLCKQLRQLNSLLLKGIASAGERGELVVRILLIDAMDNLQQGQSCTTPVYLKDFLAVLLPDFTVLPCNLKHLMEGQYDVENGGYIGCLVVKVKNRKEVSGIRDTVDEMCQYKVKVSADEIVPDVMMLLRVVVDGTKRTEKETLKHNQRQSRRGSSSRSTGLMLGDVFVVKGLDRYHVKGLDR